jgi:hypothetical protein
MQEYFEFVTMHENVLQPALCPRVEQASPLGLLETEHLHRYFTVHVHSIEVRNRNIFGFIYPFSYPFPLTVIRPPSPRYKIRKDCA